MKNRITLAIAAGILALAVSGCDNNQGLVTGPEASALRPPASAALPPVATPPAPRDPDAHIQLADAWPGALGWYDAEGHRYTLEFPGVNADADGLVRHFRDGELFAEVAPISAGGRTSVFINGQLMDDPSLIVVNPAELRAMADSFVSRGDRPGARPFRQMAYMCEDEVSGYLWASGQLIAAGYFLQRNPTSKKAKGAFLAAVIAFGSAWRALFDCEMG